MKKKYILGWIAAACLCVAMAGCRTAGDFNGSKITNEDGFQMDYTILNQTEDAVLSLTEGDDLQVEISQEQGTVSICVGINGKEPIYTGNDLTDAVFTLKIREAGNYQISVTGNKASGSVVFTRIAAEPEETQGGTTGKDNVNQGAVDQGTAEQGGTGQGTTGLGTTDRNAMYAAYQFALQQIAFEHIYPDGTDTGFDSVGGSIEDNHFAMYDINNDGMEELIVQFVTAPVAGNMETVYSYDEKTDTLVNQLSVFPAVTYYEGGFIKEEWSHGSDLAGEDYWPYNLYQYNAQTGQYDPVAEVNMWSKSVDVVDYKGDPYPEDIDKEKAGTVFILTRNGVTETISKSDYEAWLSALIGDNHILQIPYQALNEENIKKVCE